jgi:hypothetical protein
MGAPLHAILDSVVDEASFTVFAQALLADRLDEVAKEKTAPSSPYGPGANGWENQTIEQFLEAALSWACATETGLKQGLAENNPWKRFATLLYCGKIYE